MNLIIVLSALCVTSKVIHGLTLKNRIMGGVPSSVVSRGFMVSIIYKGHGKDDVFMGNGAIIHKKWAITSGSTLSSSSSVKDSWFVRGNSTLWQASSTAVDHAIVKWVSSRDDMIHHCRDKIYCRIYLIKVKPAFMAKYEKKIRIPRDFWYPDKMTVDVVGWGVHNYYQQQRNPSPVLRAVAVQLQDINTCLEIEPEEIQPDYFVCTDAGNRGPCLKDVGGSMVSGNYLISLVMISNNCTNGIAYYIKVSSFSKWIYSTIHKPRSKQEI